MPPELADVVGVLLIPPDGDSIGLLAAGRPNGSPPTVQRMVCRLNKDPCSDHRWCAYGPTFSPCACSTETTTAVMVFSGLRALPLWWEGKISPDAMDRVARAHGRAPCHLEGVALEGVIAVARYCYRPESGCTVVLVGADGREVERYRPGGV